MAHIDLRLRLSRIVVDGVDLFPYLDGAQGYRRDWGYQGEDVPFIKEVVLVFRRRFGDGAPNFRKNNSTWAKGNLIQVYAFDTVGTEYLVDTLAIADTSNPSTAFSPDGLSLFWPDISINATDYLGEIVGGKGNATADGSFAGLKVSEVLQAASPRNLSFDLPVDPVFSEGATQKGGQSAVQACQELLFSAVTAWLYCKADGTVASEAWVFNNQPANVRARISFAEIIDPRALESPTEPPDEIAVQGKSTQFSVRRAPTPNIEIIEPGENPLEIEQLNEIILPLNTAFGVEDAPTSQIVKERTEVTGVPEDVQEEVLIQPRGLILKPNNLVDTDFSANPWLTSPATVSTNTQWNYDGEDRFAGTSKTQRGPAVAFLNNVQSSTLASITAALNTAFKEVTLQEDTAYTYDTFNVVRRIDIKRQVLEQSLLRTSVAPGSISSETISDDEEITYDPYGSLYIEKRTFRDPQTNTKRLAVRLTAAPRTRYRPNGLGVQPSVFTYSYPTPGGLGFGSVNLKNIPVPYAETDEALARAAKYHNERYRGQSHAMGFTTSLADYMVRNPRPFGIIEVGDQQLIVFHSSTAATGQAGGSLAWAVSGWKRGEVSPPVPVPFGPPVTIDTGAFQVEKARQQKTGQDVQIPGFNLFALRPAGSVTYTVTAGTVPPGITVAASGQVTGTPTTPGIYSFTIEGNDGSTTDSIVVDWEVEAPPVLTPLVPNTEFQDGGAGLGAESTIRTLYPVPGEAQTGGGGAGGEQTITTIEGSAEDDILDLEAAVGLINYDGDINVDGLGTMTRPDEDLP